MNLYEVNKELVENYETMNEEQLKNDTKTLRYWLSCKPNQYFMFMCREKNYFTLFKYKEIARFKAMSEQIIEIASSLGQVKCIDFSDDHVEVWISDGKESFVYMLFGYDDGVIEV